MIYPLEIGKHHDQSEWVSCDKAHPSIVSEKTWEEAQKGARRNSNFRKPKPTSPYLLVGLIRCIKCGRNYQGQLKSRSKKKPNSYRYYVCSTYQRYGKSDCLSFSIPKEEIEKEVIDQIFKRLKRSGALDRIVRQLEKQLSQETMTPEDQVAELKSELEEVEIKERRILKSVEEGMPYHLTRERLEHLEAHKSRLQDEIAALEGSEAVVTDPETALEQMMGFLGNFRAILKEGTLDEQRTLIQCFVDRIAVDPDVPSIEVFMYKVPEIDLEELHEIGVLEDR